MANTLSQAKLKNLFSYNRYTGELRWLKAISNRPIGALAGSLSSYGYLRVIYQGKHHAVHRLIWVYVNGRIKKGLVVDHINGNRSDNRLSNLRLVSKSGNEQNQRQAHKDNTSGYLGVSWYSRYQKWRSQIKVGNKLVFLGYYHSPEEAHRAYIDAKRYYHNGCTI